jgi:microcystin-dependent protein
MPILNGRTTLTTILLGSVIPPGSVTSFAGPNAPAGWLICDGSLVSRTTYADLFAAIGTAHGSGDGSTTFQLPDYRGRFLRGADNMGTGAAGRDPNAATRTASNAGGNTGNTVGSVQADAAQGHYHNFSGGFNWGDAASAPATYVQATSGLSGSADLSARNYPNSLRSDGTNGTPRTSSESRPQNAYVEYIIKV